MKRLLAVMAAMLVGVALAALVVGPAMATDSHILGGYARKDGMTQKLFDSQHPDHVDCINGVCATHTGHSTVSRTITATYTHTHTVTDVSGAAVSTHTHTEVYSLPNATKTSTVPGTVTLAATDFATTAPASGAIPLAGTDSKVAIGWLPTGTATDKVVTGADPRLTDARASTNTLYQGTTNVTFSTGASTDTTTSVVVADNPKIHVSTSTHTHTSTEVGGAYRCEDDCNANYFAMFGSTPGTLNGNFLKFDSTLGDIQVETGLVGLYNIVANGYLQGDNLTSDGHASLDAYATHTHTEVRVLPNITKTVTVNGTSTIATTDIATATPTASKIPIADGNGRLNSWVGGRFVSMNDATNASSVSTPTDGGWSTVATITWSAANGSSLHITGYMTLGHNGASYCYANLKYDGTSILGNDQQFAFSSSYNHSITLVGGRYSITSGSHTVTLSLKSSSGYSCIVLAGQSNLVVAEFAYP